MELDNGRTLELLITTTLELIAISDELLLTRAEELDTATELLTVGLELSELALLDLSPPPTQALSANAQDSASNERLPETICLQ